ncbi:MAG: hypothetical protein GXO86_09835 [Chlorobi bacterium]|nr:hypothetical protein [Chlorobiota bacterium]
METTTVWHDSDWVTVRMDYRLKDTVLYSSKDNGDSLTFAMMPPQFEGDIYEGLKLMGVGDSFTFAVVADSFFLKTARMAELPPYVKPGSPMYFDIKLLSHYTEGQYDTIIEKRKREARQKEIETLNSYLKENHITVKPTESGLYYIPVEKGTGRKPKKGEMCRIYLEVKQLDGTLVFSNFGKDPIDVEYGKDFDTKGLQEGLGMMREGEKATLIVPSPIGVGSKSKGIVPPFTTIVYTVKLDKLRTVEEVRKERAEKKKRRDEERRRLKEAEKLKIALYIKQHQITQKPLETGLYIIPLEEGTGPKPENGDTVWVDYTLYTLQGNVIDSSPEGKPLKFVLGKGQVVAAWDEAVVRMNKGEKARLIVPSKMAYGAWGYKKIGPYTPLLFDVRLADFKKGKK